MTPSIATPRLNTRNVATYGGITLSRFQLHCFGRRLTILYFRHDQLHDFQARRRELEYSAARCLTRTLSRQLRLRINYIASRIVASITSLAKSRKSLVCYIRDSLRSSGDLYAARNALANSSVSQLDRWCGMYASYADANRRA